MTPGFHLADEDRLSILRNPDLAAAHLAAIAKTGNRETIREAIKEIILARKKTATLQ